jgi:hypothetical protein
MSDINDQAYAETVYRTIMGQDGKIKDIYAPYLRQLLIDKSEIQDL